MGRSSESFGKKNVKNKQEQKRKEKEKKRLERKESSKKSTLDDMIAYVDENGMITSTPPDPEQRTSVEAEEILLSPPKQTEEDQSVSVRKGLLYMYHESRGFGFIRDLETRESYFAHAAHFITPASEGDTVTFRIIRGQKGFQATEIALVPAETGKKV